MFLRFDPDALAWNTVIDTCQKAEKWQLALEILDTGRDAVDVFGRTAAMSACDKGSQWMLSLALLSTMSKGGIDADDACASTSESFFHFV